MSSDSEKLIIRPQKLKGDDGYKTFSIRIKEETVSKIEEISSKTGHTRNELIGIFLKYALEHYEIRNNQFILYA